MNKVGKESSRSTLAESPPNVQEIEENNEKRDKNYSLKKYN